MKIQGERITHLFQIVLVVTLIGFSAHAIYKYTNGIGVEQNVTGAYSHPLVDLAIIGLIILSAGIFYLLRWFQRKDERDFIKKYKK